MCNINEYLGEFPVDIMSTTAFNNKPQDWALLWIEKYGGFYGDSHKAWLLDQVARILKGTEVIITRAKWSDGTEEFRYNLDEPCEEYNKWVIEMKAGEDGPNTYDYDDGCAP